MGKVQEAINRAYTDGVTLKITYSELNTATIALAINSQPKLRRNAAILIAPLKAHCIA